MDRLLYGIFLCIYVFIYLLLCCNQKWPRSQLPQGHAQSTHHVTAGRQNSQDKHKPYRSIQELGQPTGN